MKSVAILGSSKLGEGPWRPGRKVWSIAIFGGSDVDFRQAELEEDVTQVVAVSIFGGNKIIVPPGLPITLSGFSLLGGREVKRPQAKEAPPASAKSLHINAISILGGFSVTEKADQSLYGGDASNPTAMQAQPGGFGEQEKSIEVSAEIWSVSERELENQYCEKRCCNDQLCDSS